MQTTRTPQVESNKTSWVRNPILGLAAGTCLVFAGVMFHMNREYVCRVPHAKPEIIALLTEQCRNVPGSVLHQFANEWITLIICFGFFVLSYVMIDLLRNRHVLWRLASSMTIAVCQLLWLVFKHGTSILQVALGTSGSMFPTETVCHETLVADNGLIEKFSLYCLIPTNDKFFSIYSFLIWLIIVTAIVAPFASIRSDRDRDELDKSRIIELILKEREKRALNQA